MFILDPRKIKELCPDHTAIELRSQYSKCDTRTYVFNHYAKLPLLGLSTDRCQLAISGSSQGGGESYRFVVDSAFTDFDVAGAVVFASATLLKATASPDLPLSEGQKALGSACGPC